MQSVGGRIEGTNTCFFIDKASVPFETKKVTYDRIVCDVRPQKEETHRTRLTVGGNLLDYEGTPTTPTATVTTAKFLFNSVVSTQKAKCVTADIKKIILTTTF